MKFKGIASFVLTIAIVNKDQFNLCSKVPYKNYIGVTEPKIPIGMMYREMTTILHKPPQNRKRERYQVKLYTSVGMVF